MSAPTRNQIGAPEYAIEINNGHIDTPVWIRCVTDGGEEYRASTREEARAEAQFSIDSEVQWRIVEVDDDAIDDDDDKKGTP